MTTTTEVMIDATRVQLERGMESILNSKCSECGGEVAYFSDTTGKCSKCGAGYKIRSYAEREKTYGSTVPIWGVGQHVLVEGTVVEVLNHNQFKVSFSSFEGGSKSVLVPREIIHRNKNM